jgi:ClpP class serine protease
MISYPQIASRLFNRPLLMPPQRLSPLLSVLGPRLGFDGVMVDGVRRPLSSLAAQAAGAADAGLDLAGGPQSAPEAYGPYPVEEGVAIIEITGTLVNRGKWIGEDCGMTSYEGLAQQVGTAGVDPGVRGILLDIASGGGEAAGCEAMANLIARVAAVKPVWAAVGDEALSAGYWLASAAGMICLPQLAEVGSVGVWCLHMDQSRAIDKQGITPSLIFAGDHKVDGHPFAALDEAVRADWQVSVDHTRRVFAEAVGRYREISVEAVLATEARCLTGTAAIQAGLADVIMDRYEAQAELTARIAAA